MVYDTEDPTLIAKMNHEMREIESMEIVGVLKYTAAGDKPAGFGVTLRCRASRNEGACGKKGEGPVRLNLTSRPTLLHCLIELRRKLQEEHGSRCIKAVNEHAEIMQDNAPPASKKCFLYSLSQRLVSGCAREAQVCAGFRGWDPRGSCSM